MTDTPCLGLPQIEAAQAQKHVTHNEALALLDVLVQLAVKSRALRRPTSELASSKCTEAAASPDRPSETFW